MTRGQCQWLRLRSGTIYTVGAIYFQSVYRQGQGYGYSRKGEVKLRLIQKHRGPEPSYTVQPNGPLLADWFEARVVAPLWGEQKLRQRRECLRVGECGSEGLDTTSPSGSLFRS